MFGLQFGLGLGARRAPPTPQGPVTIFSADPALNADDNNNNTTFRVSGTITGDAQTQLRITLEPGSTNTLTIVGLGFGKRDTSEPVYPNTLTTPVEALFGGLSGFASATTPQTSDWTDCSGLDLNEGDQIVVSYTTGGSGQASTRLNASATNADTFHQTGTHWDVANTIGLGFTKLAGQNYAVVSVETRSGGGPSGGIPMSWDDSRFASNTAGSGSTVTNAIYDNKDWNDNPSYTSGVPCFLWEGDGTDVLTMSECRVDFREGPRIGAGSTPRATLDIDQCFINCVGKTGDHADGLQAYSPGGRHWW